MEIDPVKLGVMWQKLESVDDEVKELKKDVKSLLELANKSRGGFQPKVEVESFPVKKPVAKKTAKKPAVKKTAKKVKKVS